MGLGRELSLRSRCKIVKNLLRYSQQSGRYRLDFPNLPVCSWSITNGLSRKYVEVERNRSGKCFDESFENYVQFETAFGSQYASLIGLNQRKMIWNVLLKNTACRSVQEPCDPLPNKTLDIQQHLFNTLIQYKDLRKVKTKKRLLRYSTLALLNWRMSRYLVRINLISLLAIIKRRGGILHVSWS